MEETGQGQGWLETASSLGGEFDKSLAAVEEAVGDPQAFLQTRMVGLVEVRKNLEEWTPSMTEGYESLVDESEAVEPISRLRMADLKKEAIEAGRDFDLAPAKAIFSRKAGSGRHKCRGVACGNYVGKTTTESTYASGAGSCQVRFLLKTAAIQYPVLECVNAGRKNCLFECAGGHFG